VNPTEIKIKMKPGESAERTLSIKNTGNLQLSLTVYSNIDFFSTEESSFTLAIGEEKSIRVRFTVPDDLGPGLYFGYILVSGDGIERVIPVSLEIELVQAKFSVDMMIPNEFKTLKPKDELKVQVTVFDINPSVRGNSATITYLIKNNTNGIVLEGSELITLTEQTFFKTFVLPSLAEGNYAAYVSLSYNNMVASDSETFTVSLIKPAPAPGISVIPIIGAIPTSVLVTAGIIAVSFGVLAILIKLIIIFYHSLGPGLSSVWAIKR
jgi:hypothetical protein